jgi:hypothetical protein
MAARSSVNKRQREMLRKERAADKVTRRDERKVKRGEEGPEGELLEGVLVDGVLVDGVLVDGVFVKRGPSVVRLPEDDEVPAVAAPAAAVPPAVAALPSSAASAPAAASPPPAGKSARAAK